MADPNMENIQNTVRDTTSSLKDAADRFTKGQASEKLNQFSDTASEFYAKGSEWLGENYSMAVGVAAACAVCGVIGFLIGKGMSSESSDLSRSSDVQSY